MIGILGGTFDPIHLGHLKMANEVLALKSLEEIRFIPCKSPVLKNAALASAADRLQMLKLALKNESRWVIDERELYRDSPSYMIETLRDLKKDFPEKEWGLIIGSDALKDFTRWKQWQEIIKLAKLLVIQRPLFEISEIPQELEPFVEMLKINALPISSTEVRRAIKAGLSPEEWLPEEVWDYICDHKLYR